MSSPSGPPPMPSPGWYADPEQSWTWRYWDGARWSDHRAPMAAPPYKDPHSFSAWFEDSTATVKAVIRRAGLAVLLAIGACAVALGMIVRQAMVSADGRELRSLLDLDDAFSANGSSAELTSAESDRAIDLLGDLAWTWLPWFIVVSIVFVIVMVWAYAYAACTADAEVRSAADGPGPGGEAIVRTDPTTIGAALRRVPVVFAAYLVTTVLVLLAVAVPLLPMIVLLAFDGGGVAIALSMVFGFLAAIVLIFWISVRLSLIVPLAAVGGHGLGITRSWELTQDHFWGSFARLFVAGLIASIASAPLNFIGSFGFALGFTTVLVLIVVLQTLSIAAGALISVPASAVLVVHLEEQQDLATR